MMYFIRELSFEALELSAPTEDVPARIVDLYMHLLRRYLDLGVDCMLKLIPRRTPLCRPTWARSMTALFC